MSDLTLFPADYSDARQKFLALREHLPSPKEFETWKVPSGTDPDLTVNTAYLPAKGKGQTLIVMISGVHGLEAYAGHAIQTMFMKEFVGRLDREHVGVLLVHALNPFGFKNHRRNTENQVNLNRNCSIFEKLFQQKNRESLALSDRFIPTEPVVDRPCQLLKQMRRKGNQIRFEEVSLDDFIKASGLGQFESPKGLEYGGRQAEPQISELIRLLKSVMPDYSDILLLDLHTGLGERGRLHLMTGDLPGGVHPDLFAKLFKPAEDKTVYDFTRADAEGFYPTFGATNDLFPEIAQPHQRVCAMTMEFGTIGHDLNAQLESLNLWLLEHQGSLYGFATPELEKSVRADYLEKFIPRDPLWRKQVVATSRELFERLLRRL